MLHHEDAAYSKLAIVFIHTRLNLHVHTQMRYIRTYPLSKQPPNMFSSLRLNAECIVHVSLRKMPVFLNYVHVLCTGTLCLHCCTGVTKEYYSTLKCTAIRSLKTSVAYARLLRNTPHTYVPVHASFYESIIFHAHLSSHVKAAFLDPVN